MKLLYYCSSKKLDMCVKVNPLLGSIKAKRNAQVKCFSFPVIGSLAAQFACQSVLGQDIGPQVGQKAPLKSVCFNEACCEVLLVPK